MERDFDHQLVFSFFRQHPLVTVSTISDDGAPQNAAMYMYMDEQMNCYIASREGARKSENIKQRKIATISTYDENVLMFGELFCEAELVTDITEVANLLPKLQEIIFSRKSAYWVPPIAQQEGEGFVFFKLTPKKVTFVNYEKSTSTDPHPYSVYFEMN